MTLSSDGSFEFDPQGFVGATGFSYRASDGTSLSDAVSVTLSITDRPIVRPDVYHMREDELLLISAADGLLANDSFRDGQAISATVIETTSNGALAMNPDGSFAYGPKRDFAGQDSFLYTITNGQEISEPAKVTVHVTPVNDTPIVGADAYFTLTNQILVIPADRGAICPAGYRL